MTNQKTIIFGAAETSVFSAHYEFACGEKPRGYGGWGFHPNFNIDPSSEEIFWYRGKYSAAKQAAAKHFRALRVTKIEVLA